MRINFNAKERSKIDFSTWGFVVNAEKFGKVMNQEIVSALRLQVAEDGAEVVLHEDGSISFYLPFLNNSDDDLGMETKFDLIDLIKSCLEDEWHDDFSKLRSKLERAIKMLDKKEKELKL